MRDLGTELQVVRVVNEINKVFLEKGRNRDNPCKCRKSLG